MRVEVEVETEVEVLVQLGEDGRESSKHGAAWACREASCVLDEFDVNLVLPAPAQASLCMAETSGGHFIISQIWCVTCVTCVRYLAGQVKFVGPSMLRSRQIKSTASV
jgi:succinate dehydrogenase/fumarate reductase-like Fe-S protein